MSLALDPLISLVSLSVDGTTLSRCILAFVLLTVGGLVVDVNSFNDISFVNRNPSLDLSLSHARQAFEA